MELDTLEKTLLALPPINRTVPTTITKITASITAYSAMSWPCSSDQSLLNSLVTFSPSNPFGIQLRRAREGNARAYTPFWGLLTTGTRMQPGRISSNGPFGDIGLTLVTRGLITEVTSPASDRANSASRAVPPTKDDSNTFVLWCKSPECLKMHTASNKFSPR